MKLECTPKGIQITASRQEFRMMANSLEATARKSVGFFKLNFEAGDGTLLTFIAKDDPINPAAGIEYSGPPLTYE